MVDGGPAALPGMFGPNYCFKFCFSGAVAPAVWLVGHSYICGAAQQAESGFGGRNLGFSQVDVFWRGIRGLRWPQVLSAAVEIGHGARGPVILVLHAGGNDLCAIRMDELLALMRADVERLPGFFRQVIIVWSEIIPRVVWQGAENMDAVDRARKNVNAHMARFVRSRGGVVVRHRLLEGDNRPFMHTDGIHLNERGTEIFLSGLQSGIEQALFLLGGGSGSRVVLHGTLRGGIRTYWK